mgnify:FL=1
MYYRPYTAKRKHMLPRAPQDSDPDQRLYPSRHVPNYTRCPMGGGGVEPPSARSSRVSQRATKGSAELSDKLPLSATQPHTLTPRQFEEDSGKPKPLTLAGCRGGNAHTTAIAAQRLERCLREPQSRVITSLTTPRNTQSCEGNRTLALRAQAQHATTAPHRKSPCSGRAPRLLRPSAICVSPLHGFRLSRIGRRIPTML